MATIDLGKVVAEDGATSITAHGKTYAKAGSNIDLTALVEPLPTTYLSVAQMQADTTLGLGRSGVTLGYYAPYDGGGGTYCVEENLVQSYDCIALANGYFAKLVAQSSVNIRQLGAIAEQDFVLQGKNLFVTGNMTKNGLTVDYDQGIFTLNGTANDTGSIDLTWDTTVYTVPVGTYTMTVTIVSGTMSTSLVTPYVNTTDGNWMGCSLTQAMGAGDSAVYSKANTVGNITKFRIYVGSSTTDSPVTFENLKIQIQLEYGDTATDFTAYTPSENAPLIQWALQNYAVTTIPAGIFPTNNTIQIPLGKTLRGESKAESILKCTGILEDLFHLSYKTELFNLTIDMRSSLGFSGNVISVTERTLNDWASTEYTSDQSTKIRELIILQSGVFDTHSAVVELSMSDATSCGATGFYGVLIDGVSARRSNNDVLGYFFRSYVVDPYWVSGIVISNCNIIGFRWGFFTAKTDENLVDETYLGGGGPISIVNCQMQSSTSESTPTKCFLYSRGVTMNVVNSIAWDWIYVQGEFSGIPYLLYYPRGSFGRVVITPKPSALTSYALVLADGTIVPCDSQSYARLCEYDPAYQNPYAPKSFGLTESNRSSKYLMIYKGGFNPLLTVGSGSLKFTYESFLSGTIEVSVICQEGVLSALTTKTIADTSIGYKYNEETNELSLYLMHTSYLPYRDYIVSKPLSNNISKLLIGSFHNYCYTVNIDAFTEEDVYLNELPDDVIELEWTIV